MEVFMKSFHFSQLFWLICNKQVSDFSSRSQYCTATLFLFFAGVTPKTYKEVQDEIKAETK